MTTLTFDPAAAHRHFAADCFNKTWELMRKPERTIAENRLMLVMAHASIYHWMQRGDCLPKNMCIGYWQASRVYALLNDAVHARVCGELALEHSANLEPFYAGYAYEALARADAMSGNKDGAATYVAAARKCAEQVADANDRQMLETDLAQIEGGERVLVSFVIPAHNEEALIGQTVAAIQRAAGEAGIEHEIVVVDDASDDRTAVLAQAAGARVVRIEARQISASRNAGAAAARGGVFIFVDADTAVNAGAVHGAVTALQDGAVAGGARVKFDEPTPLWARMLLPPLLWLYQALKLASGCYLFCTREAFERTGGFDTTMFAGEEVELSRALGRQGTVVMLRDYVTTSGRKVRAHSPWAILAIFARLAFRGKRGVRSRDGLEFWYGPRGKDSPGGAA